MGETSANRGGTNILEVHYAEAGRCGSHLENFAAIREFRFSWHPRDTSPSACPIRVSRAFAKLYFAIRGSKESLGARAKALAEAERGATARVLRVIAEKRWAYYSTGARRHRRLAARLWTALEIVVRGRTTEEVPCG